MLISLAAPLPQPFGQQPARLLQPDVAEAPGRYLRLELVDREPDARRL